jgi:hypothetical protein
MYGRTDQTFATAYYHGFFLIEPFDLPERLIGADPIYYLHRKIGGPSRGLGLFDPLALAEYERCYTPATIHASCEGYRAAASIDLEHGAADARSQGRMSAARALGLERRRPSAVRPDRRLGKRCARRERQGASVWTLSRRGSAGGDVGGVAGVLLKGRDAPGRGEQSGVCQTIVFADGLPAANVRNLL